MEIKLEELKTLFQKEKYIINDNILYAVFTALKLGKPLLVEGPPGVGKTELAKVLAKIFDSKLIRLQCFEGIDSSKLIYDIDYPKQLLYQNILKNKIDDLLQDKSFEESINIIENETNFYGENFIIERPILESINPKNNYKKVLLLDEIDKTDYEFEAMLLETLSDYSVSIPEFGTIKCDENNKPIIILTSNNKRELSDAMKRRCIYLYIDYPSIELEKEIISSKCNVNTNVAESFAIFINKIRNNLDLKKNPSIAESIEWVQTIIQVFEVNSLENIEDNLLKNSLNILLKNQYDIKKVVENLKEIL